VDFLVTMTTQVPAGTSEAAVQDIRTQEAARARELAAQRHLLRLWRPPLQPGEWRTLGLFAATDADQLEQILASMPLRVWRTDEVTPLSPHPNDPAGRTEPAPGTGDREFLITFTVAVPADTPGATGPRSIRSASGGEKLDLMNRTGIEVVCCRSPVPARISATTVPKSASHTSAGSPSGTT
jgi:muconolactone delta-isomerase